MVLDFLFVFFFVFLFFCFFCFVLISFILLIDFEDTEKTNITTAISSYIERKLENGSLDPQCYLQLDVFTTCQSSSNGVKFVCIKFHSHVDRIATGN
jgi:hypothetical protein